MCSQESAPLHQGDGVCRVALEDEQQEPDRHRRHHRRQLGSSSRRSLDNRVFDLVGWLSADRLTHRSKTQSILAQSTCESELLALGAGVMEGRFAQTVVEEMGEKITLEAYCDSSSAVAITVRRGRRRGLGRLRHLNVKQMWLQQEVREKRLTVSRVASAQNVSDLFAKALLGPRFRVLLDMIGLDVQPARSVNADELVYRRPFA